MAYSSSSPAAEIQGRSGINVANFVSSKLSGDRDRNNYISWKEEMLGLVENQGLVGFIDGKAPPPPQPHDDRERRRTDWLVKGFILGALSDEVVQSVVHLHSAMDVWSALENQFSTTPSDYPPPPPPPSTGQQAANVANLASTKLCGERSRNNYTSWKEQMLGLLESQGLVGFINGEAPPPPSIDIEWRRTDWLVKGCILGALNDEALRNVVNLDSARDVWLELENKFSTDLAQLDYPPPLPPPPQSNHPVAPPPSPPPPPAPNSPAPSPLLTQQPAAPPPHGSKINVVDFVSVKLSRRSDWNSYELWKEQMLFLVQDQNLDDFLDITADPPPNNDVNYSAWRQSDVMVKSWILEALSDEVVETVAHLDNATDVWQELDNYFLPAKLARQEEKEWHEQLEMYKAAMSGDLAKADMIIKRNPDAIRARVSFTLETPLHIAVASDKSLSLVDKLVKLSDDSTLSITDELGFNPLHIAAKTGNYRAAEVLIYRLPDLLYASCHRRMLPFHLAAEAGHRETLELLISHTRDDYPVNPYTGESGILLLSYLVSAGFLDMALDLVNRYPDLARMRYKNSITALDILATKDTTSAGHTQLNFWERLLHSCMQLEMEYSHPEQSLDIESQNLETDQPPRWRKQIRKLQSTLWEFISELVPCLKKIHEMKRKQKLTLRLAKAICKHMESLGYERASGIYIEAMLSAAGAGNHETVEVIVETFPHAIYSIDDSQQSFFHVAVHNRSEKVFNLLYQTNNHRYHYSNRINTSGNSMLHMAAFLAPPYKLNLVSGAALQMQRELQWFKEAEKFVSPYIKERKNNAGQTPAMLFTQEHRELKVEGERWMKDTANSCTIAAALIVTVVFAAAITVPGGNESETGYPMMSKTSAFTIFAVSDAISLFTSTTSLLMFLSILTSRYAEQDFLYALPRRLSIGLITLFLSILFMMAAFSSTVYLVFGRKRAWVLIPAAALTCLPISSFVLLQFPLLIAVISSTYGKGIFGRQSDRPFH